MKKILTISCGIFAVLAISVSCNKVSTDTPSGSNTPDTPSSEKITITATLSDALTKVSFDPVFSGTNPTSMAHKWQTGDKLRITNESSTSVLFDLVSGENTDTGTFQGPVIDGTTFSVEAVPVNSGSTGANQTQDSDGATDHLLFVASATGVTDLSNIELAETSNIIGIIANLPSGATETIDIVEIEKSVDDFATSDKLSILISNPGDTGDDDILKVYANVPASWSIAANTKMFLRFKSTNTAHTVYTRYQEFTSAVTPQAGKFNYIKINCSQTDMHAGAASSDGKTADKAYMIGDKYQMQSMKDLMKAGETRYFKLVDNIDMKDETWTRLNPDPYTAAINLDGNDKTISYLNNAFFQDFNGTATNLTLAHSTVSGSELLGVFACSVNVGATVTNVDITNGSLDADTKYCGGLIGQSDPNTSLSLSGVDVTDTNISGGLAGGIIGYPQGTTTISNCNYGGGTITSAAQYTGGIAAATGSGKTITISDCSVKNATLTSAYHRVGGLIGAMRNGTTVERCSVGESGENKEVVITTTGTAACYTGGFIGLMEGGEIKDNCNAYVKVTGVKTSIGGFIGRMTAGKVSGCKSYGTVSGVGTIGGFFGDVTGANEIINNESNCTVAATSTYVGGFVGQFKGSLSCSRCYHKSGKVTSSLGGGSECYIGGFAGYIGNKTEAFTGTISGCFVNNATIDAVKYNGSSAQSSGGWVGGFAGGIGHSTYANNTNGKVEKCGVYYTKVTGGNYCGGFAGVSYATVEKCRVNGTPTIQCYGNSNGGFIGYQQGYHVQYCYSNGKVRHANKSNVGGLIGNAKNTTVEECYSAGILENSSSTSDKSATWGGVLGYENTVTKSKLIRWNDSNAASISGGETSVPLDCHVKTSGETDFSAVASDLGWSTDGTIWTYKAGDTATLTGV